MAKVWKKQTVRWRVGNRIVKRGTPKAQREVVFSRRYYGTLRLDGKPKQVPLTLDVKSSRKLLRRLQTEADNDAANGVTAVHRQRQRPIGELLDEYVSYVRSRGVTERYVYFSRRRIEALLDAAKASTLSAIDAGKVSATLAGWRTQRDRRMSIETSNSYLRAAKGFTRWCWRSGKTSDDPLASLAKLNAETDRRHVRRSLTADELATASSDKRKRPAVSRRRLAIHGRRQSDALPARRLHRSPSVGIGVVAKIVIRLRFDDVVVVRGGSEEP